MSLFGDLRRNLSDTSHNFARFDAKESLVRTANPVNIFSYPTIIRLEDISAVTTFILSNKDNPPADSRSYLSSSATPSLAVKLADKTLANEFDGMGSLSVFQITNPSGAFREFLVSDEWIDATASTNYSGVSADRVLELTTTSGEVVWKCLEYNPIMDVVRAWVSYTNIALPAGVSLWLGSADNPNGSGVSWVEVQSLFRPIPIGDRAVYLKLVFSGTSSLDFRPFGRNGGLLVQFEYSESKDL